MGNKSQTSIQPLERSQTRSIQYSDIPYSGNKTQGNNCSKIFKTNRSKGITVGKKKMKK